MNVSARLFWIAVATAMVYWCSEDVDWMLHVLQAMQRKLFGLAVLDRLLFQLTLNFHRSVDGVAIVAAMTRRCVHAGAAWADARSHSFVQGMPHAEVRLSVTAGASLTYARAGLSTSSTTPCQRVLPR
jgi:hypothetical protein